MSKNSFLVVLSQKKVLLIFLAGKLFRFVMFYLFLYYLVLGASGIAGYNSHEILFVFLTFNFIDIFSQFLFREVYRFRTLVVTGDLDLVLVKPFNALFRSLMGGADIIDLITIPPLFVAMYYVGMQLNPDFKEVVLYIFLLFNGLLIATAFHIAVLAMAIITLEIDHLVMIYRDIVSLGKMPVDIYKEPLKSILTYLLPVGIMITFPVKVFTKSFSVIFILGAFFIGVVTVIAAIKFWNFALRKYMSASS